MEDGILDLLAGRNPKQAQDFILAFGEHRAASWADSQLGETALASASQVARAGCIPITTIKPGGVFMVARVGRFGLVSITVADRKSMPRKSPTRRLLSNPNDDIDPQRKMLLADRAFARGTTELAYFGCMVACPSPRDPAIPSEMVLAIPNARMSEWIAWIPLTRIYAQLQDLISKDTQAKDAPQSKPIPDRRIPRFKLPKRDREAGDDGSSV